MSDDLLADPRLKEAESKAFDAERAERSGDHAQARSLYTAAAELDLLVVLDGVHEPNNRSTIAEECVCLFARAGRYDRAIEAGERILAVSTSLTDDGVTTLRELLAEHRLVDPRPAKPASKQSASGNENLFRIRDGIRDQARKQEAA